MITAYMIVIGSFVTIINTLILGHIFRKRRLLQKEKEKKLLAEATAQAEEDIEKWILEQEKELEEKINLVSMPKSIETEITCKKSSHYSVDKMAFRA